MTATSVMDSLDRTYRMPDGTFDYEAVNKLIDNPDWRQANKIDVSVESILRTRYSARHREDKLITSQNEEKQLGPVYELISKGQFSSALAALDKTNLSPIEKMKWNRSIDTEMRATRTEARIAVAEKSDEIAGQILDKIRNDEPVDLKTDIFDKVGRNGLTFETSSKLVGMIGKLQKDPNYKFGYDIIDKTLKYDPVARGNALVTYGEMLKAEENMTGKRAIEIAETLIKPKKENIVKQWLKDMWNKAPSASKNPIPTAGGSQKKQIGTKDGKPVYDLGNGQWQIGD
jgi:hypothetical protein